MSSAREFHAFSIGERGYVYQPGLQRVVRTGPEQVATLNSTETWKMARRLDLLGHLLSDTAPAPPRPGEKAFDRHALYLHVANACNMRCVYCYAGGGTYGRAQSLMSPETARAAVSAFVDRIPPGQSGVLIFFGGEPLLSWDIVREETEHAEQLAGAQRKAVELHIVTNGTLLRREVVDFLADHEFRIVVSMDGGDDVQNHQRPMRSGLPSCPLVRRHLEYLLGRAQFVIARATYWDFQRSLSATYDELFEAGFRHVDVEPDFLDEGHDYGALLRQVTPLADAVLRFAGERGYIGHLPVLRKMRKLFSRSEHGPDRCGAGKVISAISPDGKIYLCHRFTSEPEITLGDVTHGYEREVHLGGAVERSPCEACWNRYLCTSGCAYDSHRLLGNTYQPVERWCRYSRRLSEVAIRVLDGIPREDRARILGLSPGASAGQCPSSAPPAAAPCPPGAA